MSLSHREGVGSGFWPLWRVVDPGYAVADSPLVGQIVFAQNGQTRMTTSKQYDALNRLTNIVSTSSLEP